MGNLIGLTLLASPLIAGAGQGNDPPVETFSIVAVDRESGEIGVAVASRVLAAGAIVPYVEAEVGAVATQAWANSSFGPRGLSALREGQTPDEVSSVFQKSDDNIARRQFGIVSADGAVAAFTGEECNEYAAHHVGDGYCVQGNILTGPEVIDAMKTAFETARESGEGELADWMLAAMTAGDDAGGDSRGKQAAAIIVKRKGGGYGGNDRFIDLRVDDDEEPVRKLVRLLELHKKLFKQAHANPPSDRADGE